MSDALLQGLCRIFGGHLAVQSRIKDERRTTMLVSQCRFRPIDGQHHASDAGSWWSCSMCLQLSQCFTLRALLSKVCFVLLPAGQAELHRAAAVVLKGDGCLSQVV